MNLEFLNNEPTLALMAIVSGVVIIVFRKRSVKEPSEAGHERIQEESVRVAGLLMVCFGLVIFALWLF